MSSALSAGTAAPVFVIGAGRSGTTFFFDLLSRHPDLAFFTNYDDILCRTPLFGMARGLVENRHWKKIGRRRNWSTVNDYSSLWPRKTEAYRFWRQYAGENFVRGYVWRERPSAQVQEAIRGKISKLQAKQKRPVFTAKLTGPGRIAYLRSIFPDARFIHLVRDVRAQVHSTLKVGFWKAGEGDSKLWWSHDLPEGYERYLREVEATQDAVALAAAQWRSVVHSIRDEAARILPAADYRECRYEDLVKSPNEHILELWRWMGLRPGDAEANLRSLPANTSANEKWASALSGDELARIDEWLDRPL